MSAKILVTLVEVLRYFISFHFNKIRKNWRQLARF